MASYRHTIKGSTDYLEIIKITDEFAAIQLPNTNIYESKIQEEILDDGEKVRKYVMYHNEKYFLDEFKEVKTPLTFIKKGFSFLKNINKEGN